MRIRLLAPLLVLVLLTGARAEEVSTAARRERLTNAARLVEQGLDALRAGKHELAEEILGDARKAAPAEAVILYDHALALAAAGKLEEAQAAYTAAIGGAAAGDAAGPAARHNLGTLRLEQARDAARLLADPDALAEVIREQPSPDGKPLTPGMVETLAHDLGGKLIRDGLEAANQSVELLRGAVRADPAARDAVRNLVLAQRARRFLLEEKEKRKSEPQKGGEDDEQSPEQEPEDSEDGSDSTQKPDNADGDQQDEPSTGDQQQPGERPEESDDSQTAPPQDGNSPEGSTEPRDLEREEAERSLQRLLDEAARNARRIEEIRNERLRRRGGVEKDW